jgi:hypothetical protein
MQQGLVNIETVDQIQARENPPAEQVQNSHQMTSLAARIRDAWNRNKDAKSDIETELLQAIRQRKGEYDADIIAKIRQLGGSEDFIRITDIKCRALEGWLTDIMLPAGEKPWSVDPTPVSELKPEEEDQIVKTLVERFTAIVQAGVPVQQAAQIPPEMVEKLEEEKRAEIQEKARKEAQKTESYIDDVLTESGWYRSLASLIKDLGTYKAVFMEGPIVENEPQLVWADDRGVSYPAVQTKPARKYYRVSPFDVYPAPGAISCDDGELIIKKRFTRKALKAFKGVDGFDSESIDLVLEKYGSGYIDWTSTDSELSDINNQKNRQSNSIGTIDALKYFGSVQGIDLLEWGMGPEIIQDPFDEYEIVAYLIGDVVISAKLNPHPLGKRGVYSTSYSHNNDSIWGDSLCDVIRDIQKICNATVRALVTNMGIAAGPQGWYNTDAFDAGDTPTDQYPLKMWPFSTQELQHGVPMGWFQADSNADVLIKVYDYFYNMASEITGIPTYMSGSPRVGGAGNTASGLSMLMNAAGKAMNDVVKNIDKDIVVKTIEETWLHIMMYDPDKAKGDIKIVARASDYLIQKETLQVRRQEFLGMTNNPVDLQIMGIGGRAEVLRSVAGELKMNRDKIVPKQDSLDAQEDQQKIVQVINLISAQFGIPVESIMTVLQGGQQAAQTQPGGQRMGGQEVRVV